MVSGCGKPSLEVQKRSVFLELEEHKLSEEQNEPPVQNLADLVTKFPGLAIPNVNKEEIELNLDDLVFDQPNNTNTDELNKNDKHRKSRSRSRERRGRR